MNPPLPLTPFERYYLADDRPEYPTSFPVELRISGPLDRATFELALSDAVSRHPLLGAVVEGNGSSLRWVAAERLGVWINWDAEPAPLTHPAGEYIDLRSEPGLRAWVRTSPVGARVVLQFHHSCCDGLAAILFVDDLLTLYARRALPSDQAPALAEIRPERLRDRAVLEGVPAQRTLRNKCRDVVLTLWLWGWIVLGRCAVLAAPRRVGGEAGAVAPPRDVLAFETHRLGRDDVQEYRGAAARHGATLNDLLLSDLALAVGEWNEAQREPLRAPCRVNVPVNVRGRSGADIPASNRLGFSFVSLAPRLLQNRDALLAEVRRQTEQIKRCHWALYFLGGLEAGSLVPGLMPTLLRRKRCFATVVLSNVGRVLPHSPLLGPDGKLTWGPTKLESITGVPPLRPNTRAALIVAEYAGGITISLRCDRHHFSTDDTRALLATYARRIRQTCAEQLPPQPEVA